MCVVNYKQKSLQNLLFKLQKVPTDRQFVPLENNWVSGLEVLEQSPNLCHLLPNVKPATL